jgi:hypothetical protein
MGHHSERAALIYRHQARGADKIITGNIDAHVEAERGRKDDGDARRASWCRSANGPLMARKAMNCPAKPASNTRIHALNSQENMRADDGNRTCMTSLEVRSLGLAADLRERRSWSWMSTCP